MSGEGRVKRYFDRGAGDFNAIYSGRRGWISKLLDRYFRWDMNARFEEAIEECGDVRGKRVLDVGCGSGRYVIELAGRGADVTGIDCSEEMLDIAGRLSEEYGVADRCRFLAGDFLALDCADGYDISLAIGFFDYTLEAIPYLKRLKELTKGKMIATFPRLWTWRAPVRRIRLSLKGCPVYFYSKRRVEDLLSAAGWPDVRIKKIGKLHFVVAEQVVGVN